MSSTGCFSDVSALASVSTSITSFDFLQTSGANSQIAIYAAAWEALEALDLPNWQASTDCILGSAQQTTGFMQQTSIPPIGFNQTSLVVPKNLQVGLNFAGTATIGDSSLSSLHLQSNSQCTATFESGGETQTILFRVNNQCPTPQDLNPITVDDVRCTNKFFTRHSHSVDSTPSPTRTFDSSHPISNSRWIMRF